MSATSQSAGTAVNATATGVATGAATSQAPRRLGLALAVIATAQLMVVLDATIVNVAMPHMQRALGFSGTNLEWVVNAYTLTFGGLLLLGGRLGDLMGRRRVFVGGVVLFAVASLVGGFATNQAWLLTARAIQGIGAAAAAPTALSLIAVTFPEGKPRNRAMGVYAAMSVAGAAVGLLVGGLLTTYVSWRWVMFVNAPIGAIVALAAPRVLGESERQTGRFDLPGAITGTIGIAALVYGLVNAATTADGVSHWGDTKVVASLIGAAVLLAAFVLIEARSKHALIPMRVIRDRNRTGSYLISLCLGTAMFGMFFFLTIFVQQIWGYSPIKTGLAYMPMVGAMIVASGMASSLVNKIGAAPLLITGGLIASGGMFWLSRLDETSTFVGGLLGPTMVTAVGMGLMFVPMSLVSLSGVSDKDSGIASSLLNVGQQVGGSIGLAILGTVAWSAVANNLHSQAADAVRSGKHVSAIAMQNHALAFGFGRGFLVSAAIALLGLVVTLVAIRIKRGDLAGINPMAAPGG